MNDSVPPLTNPSSKKSILIPFGILLILLGLFVPGPLMQAALSMQTSTLRSVSFVATDLFRLGAFVGVTTVIIGVLRNRKLKQQSPKVGI